MIYDINTFCVRVSICIIYIEREMENVRYVIVIHDIKVLARQDYLDQTRAYLCIRIKYIRLNVRLHAALCRFSVGPEINCVPAVALK